MKTGSRVPSRRMVQLDVLRGVAILMVLCAHGVITPSHAGLLEVPAQALARIGWTGVDLFFVLSGFLIGGLLMNELRTKGELDLRRFLIRRAFKIWPSYYLYLVALLVLLTWKYGNSYGPPYRLILPNLFHLQNYRAIKPPFPANHTWSLAVEEHFYLVLPILLFFLPRAKTKRLTPIPWIAFGLGITCLILRLRLFSLPFHSEFMQWPTQLRIDSLFMGVLLAYWYHFQPDLFASIARRRTLLLASSAVLICPMAYWPLTHPLVRTIGFTMLYLGYACLLVVFVSTQPGEGRIGRWFKSQPARFLALIGAFSYSIYLWHLDFIARPIRELLAMPGFRSTSLWNYGLHGTIRWSIVTVLYFAAATVLGMMMAKAIEYPALALRNRLYPSRADALGADGLTHHRRGIP